MELLAVWFGSDRIIDNQVSACYDSKQVMNNQNQELFPRETGTRHFDDTIVGKVNLTSENSSGYGMTLYETTDV